MLTEVLTSDPCTVEPADWWRRPSGLREVLVFALPLVVSTISTTIMQFTDRLFLTWYSADALAAGLPSGMVVWAVLCFPLGVASFVNPFVAQYFGAQHRERIGLAVWQGVFVGLLSLPLLLATIPLAPWFFSQVSHAPAVATLEVEYFQILTIGSPAVVISAAISSFFSGRGDVKTVMVIDTLAAALNAVLDYAWIFGEWGFPEWGMAGAAWATTVANCVRVFLYLALWLRPSYRQEYGTISGCRFDLKLFRRLIWFGSPNGIQYLFEVGSFATFCLLVSGLGTNEAAATGLAINVNSLVFMPVWGFSMAAQTLVGQRLGENRPDLAARATWSALALAIGWTAVLGVFYVFCPRLLLAAHERQGNAGDFDQLRETTVVLLRFVACYSLFDSMCMVFSCAIKGAGDTRFVLWTTLITSGFPVVFTWLGISHWGYGLHWSWLVLTVWIWALGVIYGARFLQGKWRSMRVIEPSLVT